MPTRFATWALPAALLAGCVTAARPAPRTPKTASALFPPRLTENARRNAGRFGWAARARDVVLEKATPWASRSDSELWEMVFAPTISRSWMVWSNGFCPACKGSVPMYTWEMDALERPWKTRCPHCAEVFPKNDFLTFYRSGLDPAGVFDPKRADRSLLFNADHADAGDPLRGFGVDDGEGYVEGKHRWRFIGAYLIYGQWKQAVLGGIKALAEAYVVTGDAAFAHKAGVLLDRVADLYPDFDFKTQGILYEGPGHAGYVSTWHDACEETRELVLAYDQVFSALKQDTELVSFLRGKAAKHGLPNTKSTFADIQRNIEDRILRDALGHPAKIRSNYPRAVITRAIILTALGWPESRPEVTALIDGMLKRTTAVDGVTGEKGLANYAAFGPQSLAVFLGSYMRTDAAFLAGLLERHPRLHQTYRFHIDTWCCGSYYPLSGDSGWFAKVIDQYQGVRFQRPGRESGYSHKDAALTPSMYSFLWALYEGTGDSVFVQALYLGNDSTVEGLPYDLLADDPGSMAGAVREVIAREGPTPVLTCVNKQQWHIAVLRSGQGKHERALSLDYDAGGGHSHADGMNLGLFAKGLDLMPDFGYPPVQFGGWGSPKARWYKNSASHNTVVVDGRNHAGKAGRTTLWAVGDVLRAVRASGPGLIGGKQFQRTVVLVDTSPEDSYVLDVCRVVGGTDHAKFQHSHFGTITTRGLAPVAGPDYGHGAQMRNFRLDPAPAPGWSVDWRIEDRYGILDADAAVHLRYTDLTTDAQVATAEAWVVAGANYSGGEEVWIPRIMVRRQAEKAPIRSNFVAIIEPYQRESNIATIRRLPLTTPGAEPYPDANVAVEIALKDGRRDLLVAMDTEDPTALQPAFAEGRGVCQQNWKLQTDAELCLVRLGPDGRPQRVVVAQGSRLHLDGTWELALEGRCEVIDLSITPKSVEVKAGRKRSVLHVTADDVPLRIE